MSDSEGAAAEGAAAAGGAAEGAAAAGGAAEGAAPPRAGEQVEEDETRRKFREALERKHQQQHASAEGVDRDGSEKSHGAKGPTKGRSFRRKAI